MGPMKTAPFKSGRFVQLVPFEKSHGAAVFSWFYDYQYRFFFREFDQQLSLEQCSHFDQIMQSSGVQLWTLMDVANPAEPIGLVTTMWLKKRAGVSRVGILLDTKSQHRSWCIETFIIVCDFLFNHSNCRKVVVECLASDQHIRRISEKGGFVFEATLQQEAFVDGVYQDEVRYFLTPEIYDQMYGDYFSGS